MQISFFATEIDEFEVWKLAFALPGMRVYEAAVHGDRPLREFFSAEEVREARAAEPYISLKLHPSLAGGAPVLDLTPRDERYPPDPGNINLQKLVGPALIGFNWYGWQRNSRNCLQNTVFSAWNLAGARSRSIYPVDHLDEVDWKMLNSIFGKLRRQIHNMAVAKIGSSRVLPDAFRRLASGEITLWGWGEDVSISSPNLVIETTKLH
ncbi:hypothetical protein ACFSCV_02475 [Methylopila henanensis]|uniref:Uncharacterized protein n=1 Tax=Methylopila henanensis TaxID=873516 RepID=A0ABW4K708_9HYPH